MRQAGQRDWLPATVPGCLHTDLIAAKRISDPFYGLNELDLQWIEEETWEYRVGFDCSDELRQEECVDLVADGLDTVALVTLNGKEVARTENMFTGYRWPVKALLKPAGNELVVRFESAMDYIRNHRTNHRPREINDPVGGCTRIRKQQCQFGWDWGPRFVTAGIWRGIRLEGWSVDRLDSVRIEQKHGKDGGVSLRLSPEPARGAVKVNCQYRLTLDGVIVAEGKGTNVRVPEPRLWWPNGQGEQPLYHLEVDVAGQGGRRMGRWSRRIGLRKIELDRRKDKWGEAFQFRINGRPVFAKGANWIPAHTFVAGLARKDYERDIRAAAEANMNMIRVWGGGIYESEDFFDLCDELGLLVWQDFMFACTLYPGDASFVKSVEAEAEYQVRRLRHRASLALWCGNNEVWHCNGHQLEDPKFKRYRKAAERLFHEVLPKVVEREDPATPYWPSSPWRGDESRDHETGTQRGDTHFWDVWHGRAPVGDYEKWPFRFVSEFGMQSYSSPATNATFCPKDNDNIFGPVMENHQKNRGGNQVILDYVSRRYRFPKSQEDLIYLSQLNQAHCMQTGVEYYRRNRPRCMGALYWQLNDCWPVASWSSIEFTGRWRVLHHLARRFFAPVLVTAQVQGTEGVVIGNYRKSTVHAVELYTVNDRPEVCPALLRWDVMHVDGRRLGGGMKRIRLAAGASQAWKELDLSRILADHGTDNLYLRIALDIDGARESEETVFLTAPRFVALPKGKTTTEVKSVSPREYDLTLVSTVFQHRFAVDFKGLGLAFKASDNSFELYPDEPKRIRLRFDRDVTVTRVRRALICRSLVDTY